MKVYSLSEKDNQVFIGMFSKEKLESFFQDLGGEDRFSIREKDHEGEPLDCEKPSITVGSTAIFEMFSGKFLSYVEHGHHRDADMNALYSKAWCRDKGRNHPALAFFCGRITDRELAKIYYSNKFHQLSLLELKFGTVYCLGTLEELPKEKQTGWLSLKFETENTNLGQTR